MALRVAPNCGPRLTLPAAVQPACRTGTGFAIALKHSFDRVFAAAVLLLGLPLMVLIAVLVWCSLRGPVLYRDRRLGAGGREFEMLKFRTMSGAPQFDGEADGAWINRQVGRPVTAAPREDRQTRVGRLLRRWSLDELPQLVNVVKGDMSIVGPRPERAAVAELFEQTIEGYAGRLRMRPGMTGWSQVRGLRGQTSLAERVRSDNDYIERWSLRLDVEVLARTIPAMLRGTRPRA